MSSEQILAENQSVAEHLAVAMRDRPFREDPWCHLYVPEVLPPHTSSKLARTFPHHLMSPSSRSGSDKDYSLWTADVSDLTHHAALPKIWAQFLSVVAGDQYRALLGDLSGVDLTGLRRTSTLWEYRNGDFLAPHVDKVAKIVTQIFYLTENWTPDDGGQLMIQSSPAPSDTVAVLAPRVGSSAVLVRSDSSWHSVEQAVAGSPRRSLNVTFWAPA